MFERTMQFSTKKKNNNKTNFVRNQLQKNTKKPKELWKVMKNIGLPSKAAPVSRKMS